MEDFKFKRHNKLFGMPTTHTICPHNRMDPNPLPLPPSTPPHPFSWMEAAMVIWVMGVYSDRVRRSAVLWCVSRLVIVILIPAAGPA